MTTPWDEAITASNLCNDAAIELGAIGEGEVLADGQPADVLRRLNWLLDSSQLDRSKIFRYSLDSGILQPGVVQYSVGKVGSGATFAVAGGRPLRIWWAYVRNASGVDVPVAVAPDRATYDAISLKTGTNSSFPQLLFYDPQFPLGQMFFLPVPSEAFTIFWVADGQISQFPTLNTAFSMPPGYYRWLVYALAIEITDYFQISPPQTVLKKLADAAQNLANYNRVDARIGNDAAQVARGGWYDLYKDMFGGRT